MHFKYVSRNFQLIELEKQLRREIKSRDRAEKRLNSLIKKLESINIAYVVSDESEQYSNSSILEKTEFSSVSSSTASSSYPKCPEDDDHSEKPNHSTTRFTNSTECDVLVPMKESPSSKSLKHNVSTTSSESCIVLSSNENIESDKSVAGKSDDLNGDDHRYVKSTFTAQ